MGTLESGLARLIHDLSGDGQLSTKAIFQRLECTVLYLVCECSRYGMSFAFFITAAEQVFSL
jgi:hypothetical protein